MNLEAIDSKPVVVAAGGFLLSKQKQLKREDEKNEWTITSFLFTYKSIKYVVFVRRFIGNVKNPYALVKLNFI